MRKAPLTYLQAIALRQWHHNPGATAWELRCKHRTFFSLIARRLVEPSRRTRNKPMFGRPFRLTAAGAALIKANGWG